MFRELVRKHNELPHEVCVELLKNEKRGVLSVLGDDDYPYGTPMNHFYNEEDGAVYFHCGKIGHRLDAVRKHSKASFCVYDQGIRKNGNWAYTVNSVIIFGKIEIIENPDIISEITHKLSFKFIQDEDYIMREIKGSLHRTILLKLTPDHICGKSVLEA